MSPRRILIVEDEAKLLDHLTAAIGGEGFAVSNCVSFQDLKTLLFSTAIRPFHLIILDRLLHGRDSAELVPQIKEKFPRSKIMILSAIDTASEKAALLDLGADDYLAKPFEVEELIARVRVLLRRDQMEFRLGNVLLNSEKRVMNVDDHEFALQNREFILLRTLIRVPNKIHSKAELYEQAWEMSADVESNVIETTVTKLRRRLEEAGANISIKSLRNKGYWIEE